MTRLAYNFLSGTLDVGITNVATTLESAGFALMPTVVAPDTAVLTLDPDAEDGVPEIVEVTSHASSSTEVTVVRGQQTAYGASAGRTHAVDTVWRWAYTAGDFLDLQTDIAAVQAGKLNLAGGTMVGNLFLSDTQSGADAAATRHDYVVDLVATRVAKAGDTMTGALNGVTPTATAHLTRKDYVDTQVGARVATAGDTMTGQLNGITPVADANLTRKDYVDTRIDSRVAVAGDTMTGDLVMNATSDVIWAQTPGEAGESGARLYHDGRLWLQTRLEDGANLVCIRDGAEAVALNQKFANFLRGVEDGIGSISIASASAVAYNTSSDRRLKRSIGDVDDAAETVKQLGALAYRGRWLRDGEAGREWVFLNSQDIEQFAPYAVMGDPDGVDERGEIVAQEVDFSKLVPLLTAGLSQALERIEALEEHIAWEGGAT